MARISWDADGAQVSGLVVGANDVVLLEYVTAADKAGIDSPLGWPQPFVEFVTRHQAGAVLPPVDVVGKEWRRRLANRQTDLAVRDVVGLVPLSVATDRIGMAAMRCAGLLGRLAAEGAAVDRTGTGVVVEVYPAAALRCWGLPFRGYKGGANSGPRNVLVDRLVHAAPWLRLGASDQLCRRSDHAVDAVVAALNARAAALGRVTRPTAEQWDAATTEGWIALPTGGLDGLRGGGR